ncbi:Mo25 family protein [Aspergillus saccharolyticus JOP 1030-1]|uniref:Conidiophore development protein HymA n=1 Tax=Aspergillus saccharolyticus JOP 1030-1 TaxID=1450539 RepID=A0A318ZDT6_9EURO|nr:conidiophore development protein HymA [Aspergillus saccharolyticus JOP 1030-1]PYH45529.1 conidiophore development protein HymA [Aspergillus saccharolyticus JOP 1030-1]
MAFFFNRGRSRQPSDLVRTIKDTLVRIRENPSNNQEAEKPLAQMKVIVQGTQDVEVSPDQVQSLIQAALQEDLLYDLARSLHLLPFEARKDTQAIFSHILRFRPANASSNQNDPPVISYIVHNRPEVIIELCKGYEHSESAMPCGVILREALKFDVIAAIILYDQSGDGEPAIKLTEVQPAVPQDGTGIFWRFFYWIDRGSFELSADSFTTFREILTRHKNLVTGYLSTNFDRFFAKFNEVLVNSNSYVTKRQSIKLLGEILLDRANYNVMMAYVESGDNLKLCMKLLRDDRKMVQYEGFHVFKVFVANPNKSVAVQRILINNRDRLLRFLPRFLEDRTEDDQFTDEKSFLVRQIELLPNEPVEPARSTREPSRSGVNAAAVA